MTAIGAGRARRTGQPSRLVINVSSPFRLDYVVWALRRRAHNEVDRFDAGCYRRVLSLAGEPAEVTVRAFRLETARAGVRFVDGELVRLAEGG